MASWISLSFSAAAFVYAVIPAGSFRSKSSFITSMSQRKLFCAWSMRSWKASCPMALMNSSGSLYGFMLMTLLWIPTAFSIGIARFAALMPAPSES